MPKKVQKSETTKEKVKKTETDKQKVSLEERKAEVVKKASRRRSIAKDKKRRDRKKRKKDEFDTRIVSIRRVSKVKAGGRRMRLSVMVVIGDRKGKIGVAVAKANDVRTAQQKAVNKAKKKMIKVNLKGQTIPHEITQKYKAAKLMLKPARPGTGVIAGGAVREVVEVAGIKDVLTKQLGSNNSISNTYATLKALSNLKLKRIGK